MKFQLELSIPALVQPIKHTDSILLVGSCFTEHMAERLVQHKFEVCSNPNGILFTPLSVARCLQDYLTKKQYQVTDLFYLNELWNSWSHHTRFSDVDAGAALAQINAAQAQASKIIAKADWIIITLGSAFQYYLKDESKPVANNHRAPGQWFKKKLLSIELMVQSMSEALFLLQHKNPKAQVLFTISPVRHIRDGVVDNNRSKARLIEVVHELCHSFPSAHYFPAYELVMDVLRDYRFFDIDLVHPNYAATSYVWDAFTQACMTTETRKVLQEMLELNTAQNHRPRFPETKAHKDFCVKYAAKAKAIQAQCPYLDLTEIIKHFESPIKE